MDFESTSFGFVAVRKGMSFGSATDDISSILNLLRSYVKVSFCSVFLLYVEFVELVLFSTFLVFIVF